MTIEQARPVLAHLQTVSVREDFYAIEATLALIDREIERKLRRKMVPLKPCKCGAKRPSMWSGGGYQVRCNRCDAVAQSAQSANAARRAWNMMVEYQVKYQDDGGCR